jgi:hypothetical protein
MIEEPYHRVFWHQRVEHNCPPGKLTLAGVFFGLSTASTFGWLEDEDI